MTRIHMGLDAVREIVGKVWPYVLVGIAVGAAIHGYVPENFMASFMAGEPGGLCRCPCFLLSHTGIGILT